MVQNISSKCFWFFLSLCVLVSCSKDDNKTLEQEQVQLILNASSTSFEIGDEVSFEVTAEGNPVSGVQVWVDGTLISSPTHTFATIGTYQVIAKKEGYLDSDTLSLEVTESQPDVYVAGYTSNGSNSIATYWINGTPVNLTDGSNDAKAFSVFISNGDVYVAGDEFNGSKNVAIYWKNGSPINLTDGSKNASAKSIFVYNDDVYVGGYENNTAKYWKNGAPIAISGSTDAHVSSIFVSNGDVHLAGGGSSQHGTVAKYWINGILTNLTTGNSWASAYSVFVSEGDVYVAGYEYEIATYWKNGVVQNLSDAYHVSHAKSIFVAGSDVHIVGTEFLGPTVIRGKHWKNRVLEDSFDSSGMTVANSVYVYESDVYVAGSTGDFPSSFRLATYWKNGQPVALTNDNGFSEATSIFVVGN